MTPRARRAWYLLGAGVLAVLAALVVSPVLAAALLIGCAICAGTRRPRRRTLLTLLVVSLLLGAGDVALHIDYYDRQDCGPTYTPDLGCMNALPGWLVVFGFGMLVVAVVTSVLLVIPPTPRTDRPSA